jgi:putative methyltransferase (TIGR04325 family)
MLHAKDVIRSLSPPIIWRIASRLKSGSNELTPGGFEGPFSSWEEAVSRSDGWDSPLITEKTFAAALKVRDGLAAYEQDGLPRNSIIYSCTILSFLILSLSRSKHGIDIIDFGGGLGSNYIQNRAVLRHMAATPIRWNVVERPIIAKLGLENFRSDELFFYSSLQEAWLRSTPLPDSILFSGSLQYVASPFALLDEVISANLRIIALDRVLIAPRGDSAPFVQHPDRRVLYQATYPVWCFSRDKLILWFRDRGFELVEHFTSDREANFDHCGMIFVRSA